MSEHEQNGQSHRKRYSKKRKEFEFEIEDEAGNLIPYVLRGLDGPGREEFMSFMAGKAKLDKNGNPAGIRDMKGMTLKLLCRCVFDSSGTLVPEQEITSWPGDVQGDLFEEAQKLSGLGRRSEEEAKNE